MKKEQADVKPKKHLGQHFLTDELIAQRIVNSLMEVPGIDNVLEIGPGMGVLTKYLIDQPIQLKLVEIDADSISYLKANLPLTESMILHDDFLQLDFAKLGSDLAIIGNFPYNISSQILFKVLDFKDQVQVVVGMFQKEVASRIASPPGNKDYGIPSVFLQAWYDIEYLFTVDAANFNPPPKIQSGVIRLVRNKRTDLGCDQKAFKRVVKQAFNQRRKTLRNSLRSLISSAKLSDMPFASLRPEQLSWQQFVVLTNFVEVLG